MAIDDLKTPPARRAYDALQVALADRPELLALIDIAVSGMALGPVQYSGAQVRDIGAEIRDVAEVITGQPETAHAAGPAKDAAVRSEPGLSPGIQLRAPSGSTIMAKICRHWANGLSATQARYRLQAAGIDKSLIPSTEEVNKAYRALRARFERSKDGVNVVINRIREAAKLTKDGTPVLQAMRMCQLVGGKQMADRVKMAQSFNDEDNLNSYLEGVRINLIKEEIRSWMTE